MTLSLAVLEASDKMMFENEKEKIRK